MLAVSALLGLCWSQVTDDNHEKTTDSLDRLQLCGAVWPVEDEIVDGSTFHQYAGHVQSLAWSSDGVFAYSKFILAA